MSTLEVKIKECQDTLCPKFDHLFHLSVGVPTNYFSSYNYFLAIIKKTKSANKILKILNNMVAFVAIEQPKFF